MIFLTLFISKVAIYFYYQTQIQKMFYDCERLKEIDLTSFNINRSNLECNNMFSNYSNIKFLIIRKGKFNTNILTILKKYKNIRIIELNK